MIFPTQGLNPRLLHWQADSLPLSHQWSPAKGPETHDTIMCKSSSDLQSYWKSSLCPVGLESPVLTVPFQELCTPGRRDRLSSSPSPLQLGSWLPSSAPQSRWEAWVTTLTCRKTVQVVPEGAGARISRPLPHAWRTGANVTSAGRTRLVTSRRGVSARELEPRGVAAAGRGIHAFQPGGGRSASVWTAPGSLQTVPTRPVVFRYLIIQ